MLKARRPGACFAVNLSLTSKDSRLRDGATNSNIIRPTESHCFYTLPAAIEESEPSMSPPSALANADILYEIFRHLSVYPNHHHDLRFIEIHPQRKGELKRRRNALANAARTCKAFSGFAYDVLWAVLPELVPILSIFSGYRVEKYKELSSGTLNRCTAERHVVDGEISPSEWARLDRLENRVRCFTYGDDEIAGPLLHLLASRHDSSPLFPNLRLLIWSESRGDTGSQRILKSLCAAPNLSIFTIRHRSNHGYSSIVQDLSVVAVTHPDLPHIRTDSGLSFIGERTLTIFRNLRSARLRTAGNVLFRHLATLNRLEELHVKLVRYRDSNDTTQGKPLPKGSFPALRRLIISESGDDTTVLHGLSAVSSASLSSLSVQFQQKCSSDALRCVESLSSLPVLQPLRKLNIRIDFDVEPFRNRDGVERMEIAFSDFLKLLLHLRGLEDITLDVYRRAWSISDDDIETVKIAWPHLVRLSVRDNTIVSFRKAWQPDGVPIVRPSLNTLVAFAERCRQLTTLDIEVSGISDEELIQLETRAAQAATQLSPQTALQKITFARQDYREQIALPDVDRLAQALHEMFPRLGGLGDPIEGRVPVGMEGQLMYDGWSQRDMTYKVFRLLETLEKLKVRDDQDQRLCRDLC